MKLIIAGSRNMADALHWIDRGMAEFYKYEPDLIISGGGGNVDNAAIVYAEREAIPFEVYIAEWKVYGKGAGPVRNKAMAEVGTQLLVIWNGKSRGTANMIKLMHQRKKRVCVVKVIGSTVELYEDKS